MNTLINLSDFREKQSTTLGARLQIFKENILAKYGTYDDIKTDEMIPLQSRSDVDLINKLVDTKDFVIIPVYNGNSIIQVYTIGLWYYWGLPELVFNFTTPIKKNQDFVHIFINIIKSQLDSNYHNKIVIDSKTIDRSIFNYDNLQEEILLNIDKYDVDFIMKKMDDMDYLDKNTSYLLWFYMYYMDIKTNTNNEPILYPLYKIDVNYVNYSHIEKKVNSLIAESTNNLHKTQDNDSDLSSIESDNE